MLDSNSTVRAALAACRNLFHSTFAGLLLSVCLTSVPVSALRAQAETPANIYMDTNGDGELELVALDELAPPGIGSIPVLFVHGHNTDSDMDEDLNFEKNWKLPLNGFPSFKQALDHVDNAGLGIEAYFIRFIDQHRSIVADAREIEWAVEHILKRHDTSHDPFTQTPTTTARVAIIGYSKGAISSRCYLRSLQPAPAEPGPCDFGVPRNGFNPVSEFVAIAPPNHGLDTLGGLTSLAGSQLKDGYGTICFVPLVSGGGFISSLNGHPTTDSKRVNSPPGNWIPGPYAGEAPGIRSNGSSSASGTLYLSLYANGALGANDFEPRDFVGGHYPSDDCRGRKLARNLASGALNIPVSTIDGSDVITVHKNTVHGPRVICLALYAVSHHNFPTPPESVTCEADGQIPLVPLPPPWWWPLVLIILSLIVVWILVVVLTLKPKDG